VGSPLDLSSLIVPAQSPAEHGTFDTRPKAVNAWIESLPMANLGETSRLVFKAIVELNRIPLPASKRLKTMELILEPVMYVSACLEKYFAARPLPLNPKHRKISELARALLSEMATGYKLVARDLLAEKQKPNSKEASLALHRAMHFQGLLLLRCYQVYAPCPKNIWKELHTMYAHAEHYDIGGQRFTLPEDKNAQCSLADIYKRILLLSLSMPYQLLRGEIDIVVNNLCSYVPKLRIEKIADDSKPEGLFIVDLSSDREPCYLANYTDDDFSACRIFNLVELVEALHHQDMSSRIPQGLLHRLLASWSIMPKRSFSRTNIACAPVEVAFGLSAAHHFVSGELEFNPDISQHNKHVRLGEKSEFTSTFVANLSDEYKGPDVWDTHYCYSDNDPHNAPSLTQGLTEETHNQPVSYSKLLLEMANTSAGGYCLVANAEDDFSAHVGVLLAIREQQNIDIDQWGIGVIRRMKNCKNAKIELGVQMLTPNAVAVAAKLVSNDGKNVESQFLRCLMLPEMRTINQPATLITPNLPFRENSQILINIHDRFYQATLTNILQRTNSFSQFEFSMSEASKQEEQDTGINENDFDSVWTSL
jgi:hypothetical protein